MSLIHGISAAAGVRAVSPTVRAARAPTVEPLRRERDDASSLPSARSLRVRLASSHAETLQLQRTIAVVDSADEALARTESLLDRARSIMSSGDVGPLDPILVSIDDAAAAPKLGGAPILHEGVTLRAGSSSIDLRPVGAEHLGAVIESGRSHRLSDLRSGGSLDASAHRTGALRSLGVASMEIASVRSRLGEFRSATLAPAQRDALSVMRAAMDTGPLAASEAFPIATTIRGSLATSDSLAELDANAVLSLLK